ncbi:hypothetical protein HUA74_31815 [Myxococcus sp. CA051A]|uniref:hypothetical protein n=1 Tax=unclassified Myxococcus TaxID=2648731 RepID=UPI00157AEF86|nr:MULTISPECIES: hypothetical protein [unclassified Myxococcus]NTX00380.1 hypothetical protein [Myxococcus sp. CA040A]NTX15877.1 hypothetical protein [Myxococcus sp. CA056]NTX65255.1 hypothetical protein [Myxococcus sp. CA051A]
MRLLPFLLLALAATPASAQRGAVPSGCQEDYATCKEDCSIEYGGSGRTVKKLTQCLGICTENRGECSDRHSSLRGLPDSVVADEPRRRRPSSKQPVSREEDPFGDSTDSEPRRTTNREEDPFGDARPDRDSVRGRRDGYRADSIPAEDTRPPPEEVQPAAPVDTTPVPPVSRQGVYRAADSEPKPAPAKPAPEAEPDFSDLEPLDAPPAPTASAKPTPRMEPVKPAPAKPAPTIAASDDEKKDPLLDDEPAPAPVAATKKPAPPPSNPLRPSVPPEPKTDISEWDPNGD